MKVPGCLYHWSPASRRKQIERHGLRPGMRPVTHFPPGGPYEGWRAQWVCLAEDPHTAWRLSAAHRARDGYDGEEWDLWQVHLADGHKVTRLSRPRGLPVEWRVHDRIYKRGVVYIATCTN